MEKCRFEQYLVDYLNKDLPDLVQLDLANHLKHCEICTYQLKELKSVHFMLMERKRPEPTVDLFYQYRQELNEIFESRSRFKKINERFNFIRELMINIPSLGIRLAGAITILIIGIFIGKTVFKPAQKSELVVFEPTMMNLLENQSELKLMNNYFSDSEVLLLEILNSNLAEELEDQSLFLSKELAQKLLMQTFLIHEIAFKIGNKQVVNFLTNLDLLLYDIANSNEDEIILKITEIQDMIRDTNLLEKVRIFHEFFDRKTIKQI